MLDSVTVSLFLFNHQMSIQHVYCLLHDRPDQTLQWQTREDLTWRCNACALADRLMPACECIATDRGLPTQCHPSVLGAVLPTLNCPWLVAGPRVLIAFTAGNGNNKFFEIILF